MGPWALKHCPFLSPGLSSVKWCCISEVYFLITLSVSQSCYENQWENVHTLNSMAVPQKVKSRITMRFSIFTSAYIRQKNWKQSLKMSLSHPLWWSHRSIIIARSNLCPLVDECANKMIFTSSEVLFGLKGEGNSDTTTWRNLKAIMLKEMSGSNNKYCMISLLWGN